MKFNVSPFYSIFFQVGTPTCHSSAAKSHTDSASSWPVTPGQFAAAEVSPDCTSGVAFEASQSSREAPPLPSEHTQTRPRGNVFIINFLILKVTPKFVFAQIKWPRCIFLVCREEGRFILKRCSWIAQEQPREWVTKRICIFVYK